jgi:plastocyanin
VKPVRSMVLAIVVSLAWTASASAQSSSSPLEPLTGPNGKPYEFIPKAPGTREQTQLWYGPYTVPPGQDMNRVDLDLPMRGGFLVSIDPGMRRVADLSEPSHQEAHIHHAHWFALQPGNKEDNYTHGNTEWIFGNGDEETKADFAERSAADPNGPNFGEYVAPGNPQVMIYMLHNKTNQPLVTWIVLDVTFVHGTKAQLDTGKKPWHDLAGVLFGRTFNVPVQPNGDGKWDTTHDMSKPIEWTSTLDGTIIGTGSHVHPGGLEILTENFGSKASPCPDDHKGTGGTLLLDSKVLWHYGAMFSEDYQTTVTNPNWRAPIHKGDVLRITGYYANKDTAWYTAMTHNGLYIDTSEPPQGHCKPYLVGNAQPQHTVYTKKKSVRYSISKRGKLVRKVRVKKIPHTVGISLTDGVPNRPWGHDHDTLCGVDLGKPPCERPYQPRPAGDFASQVLISDFQYIPGDTSLSGSPGLPPKIHKGQSLTFVNTDESANIRHSVTTCNLPCNGTYVANYPWANGVWDSGTLGYDAIDGGTPDPVSSTPPTLPVGRYAYFCRIHPWMRGQFEVVP